MGRRVNLPPLFFFYTNSTKMKNGVPSFLRWFALWLGCLALCHGALAQTYQPSRAGVRAVLSVTDASISVTLSYLATPSGPLGGGEIYVYSANESGGRNGPHVQVISKDSNGTQYGAATTHVYGLMSHRYGIILNLKSKVNNVFYENVDIHVAQTSALVDYSLPLPATLGGDRVSIYQNGVLIHELVRTAGAAAQIWTFSVTPPVGEVVAVYGELGYEYIDGVGVVAEDGEYLERSFNLTPPSSDAPDPPQPPITPIPIQPTTPPTAPLPPPPSPITGATPPVPSPVASPVIWSRNPVDHSGNVDAKGAVERGTEINAEGLAKVVSELREHNEREKQRQEAANALTDQSEAKWTDLALSAHAAAVEAVIAPAEIFGDALSPGRGADTTYTPPASPSGFFTVNTPFWGQKSINPFEFSADRLGGDGSGRDWSVLADVTKAIIAWSTLFWLYYYILGEFKTAVADLFKVTTPTGEGAAISVILNQQVLGTNVAAAAIPAKLLLMAAGLAFWITVPAILLAALEGALTFSFDGSGTSSLVSVMKGGPSWMSAIWSLVSEVLPLATMITASATYALVRMGLITAQGTLSLVVRYISSMG